MKKPTREVAEWHRIHSKHLTRRRFGSKKRRARVHRRPRTKLHAGRITRAPIVCPEDFSLESNFDGVVDVLQQIRDQSARERNERPYIDFRDIRTLSPSGALVLAAELDRWNHHPLMLGRRLKADDVHDWDPRVRRLLADMGFFDLLEARHWRTEDDEEARMIGTKYVQFRTGTRADGEAIERLRSEDLEPVMGALPSKAYLYTAVTEAMINVAQHAYGENGHRPNWWLSASHERAASQVTIMIYDQGAGIPETLPRKLPERILRTLSVNDHAQMIRAAHDSARSATGQKHRGHGLEHDVRGYLERINCHGYYRVVSLAGEYICEKRPDGHKDHELKRHGRNLYGTLIEWKLTLK